MTIAAVPPATRPRAIAAPITMRARRTGAVRLPASQPEADPQQAAADWCESG